MARKSVKPSVDRKVFRATSSTHKSINVKPTTYRGGIRL